MPLWIIRPLRFLWTLLSPDDSPRQLALGLALGVAVGLMPKGNLTAVVLTSMLFASKVNLGSGMIAAFCFSWIGSLLDPISHAIGMYLLTMGPMQGLYAAFFDLPLAPWTGLNNTVVLGSLVVGVAQFYVTYRLSRPVLEKYQPVLLEKLRRFRGRRAQATEKPPVEQRAAA